MGFFALWTIFSFENFFLTNLNTHTKIFNTLISFFICYIFFPQAIKVLRTANFTPIIVFIAAPTLPALQEVHGGMWWLVIHLLVMCYNLCCDIPCFVILSHSITVSSPHEIACLPYALLSCLHFHCLHEFTNLVKIVNFLVNYWIRCSNTLVLILCWILNFLPQNLKV